MEQLPSFQYLIDLKTRLQRLGYPVYFKLPAPEILEPFVVIGANSSDTSKTAQTGCLIEDLAVLITIFMPIDSRNNAEKARALAMRYLPRGQRITSEVSVDDSIGREVYKITIRVIHTIM
ncbi:MAG: hypothetical protein Q4A67_07190 [Aerococcus sp.]|nr:hypothetical protein [Aerococcus sp.]